MKKTFFSLLLCALVMGFGADTAKSSNDAELVKQLERIFSQRPDLVINVLRKHSELVLDIAQEGSTKRRKRSLEAEWRKDMEIPKKVETKDRPVLGPKDAKIKVIEFSDFTCPYCATAAANLKKLMEEYGNKVNLVFKHTPLSNNPTAILASEYVIAAGFQSESKSWKLYDICFEKRGELMEKGEAFLKAEAKKLELDVAKLAKDAKSKKTKDIIAQDLDDAQKVNVEGTPYFLVNNIIVRGALPYELFKAAFELALEGK